MVGGGLKKKLEKMSGDSQLNLFCLAIMILLLKTFVVQWTYNMIWPKLMVNSGNDISRYTPLTFYEALLFVILIDFLF